ncbi:MAG TPA: nickel insertion protein, partial [Nocardioidaceae bacterium]|nr:nickel insertion protein [Nocardioidaceae bacterium]
MIGWVDASSGASGDMLLGALLGAGVPVDVVGRAVLAVAAAAGVQPGEVSVEAGTATRTSARVAAKPCRVAVPAVTDTSPGPAPAAVAAASTARPTTSTGTPAPRSAPRSMS